MLKLFKYLKKSTLTIIFIIILLFFQAYCDLSLPDYTSRIVNIGIQQSGIEEAVPEAVRQSKMENILLFTDEEITSHYQLISSGDTENQEYEKYVKEYPVLENENIYVLKNEIIDEETKSNFEKAFFEVSMLENEETQKQLKEAIMQNIDKEIEEAAKINQEASQDQPQDGILAELKNELPSKEETLNIMKQNMENQNIFDIMKSLPEEQRKEVVEQFDTQIEKMTDAILEQSVISEIKEEYIALGVDVNQMQTTFVILSGLQMLGIAILSMTAAVIVNLLSSKVAAKFAKILREKVFMKVIRFSNAEFNKFSTASLITRSTNDIQQMQMIITMLFKIVIYSPIIGIGGVIKVSGMQNSMTWVIGIPVFAIIVLVMLLFTVAMPKFRKMQSLIDKVNLVAREILTGLPVIRAFSSEKIEEKRFDDANTDLMKTNLFVNRVMSIMMPSMMFIMNATTVLIVWVGSGKVDQNLMQVGDMMAFLQYTMQIIMSFLMISMISIMLPRASVSGKRIVEVLNEENSIEDPENPKKFDESKKGLVEFKNVSFKYPDGDEYALEDINFVAEPGKTTAIIGSTGSGKSTIVNLIPRFFDATLGEVRVDGVDIKQVKQKDLRDKLGLVPQKGILFSGTIESNIKYGAPDASEKQMKKAAEIAQATEFIEQKPEKYDSEIAQGGNNVSGGQKQRLSIARAIAKKPEIMIFDDSFSALDYKTDAKLRKELREKVKNTTLIIVAQRISTVLHADQIIVLDEGKIVGKGTHEELMKNCEVYQQIALSQLSKEELDNG